MMAAPTSQWAGADLYPLVFESEQSVLLRFAWRNAMLHKLLKAHFSSMKKRFVLDPRLLSNATGFFVQPIPEQDRYGASWNTFLSSRFRYCPICLEHGYHSYLFQCLELQCCPLHHIALSTQCHCCRSPAPKLSASSELYAKPYYCSACKAPLCGVPPLLDAHLDLRATCSQLESALLPYDLWWRASGPHRADALSLAQSDRPSMHGTWCEVSALLRTVAATESPPAYIAAAPYPNASVVQLRWEQRISMGSVVDSFLGRVASHRWMIQPNAVYRCTLRLLQRWIENEEPGVDAGVPVVMDSIEAVRASPYLHRTFALSLMRRHLEGELAFGSGTRFRSPEQARLQSYPAVEMGNFNVRTSRLAWRAFFLATYASWYECIQNGTAARIIGHETAVRWDAGYIFFRSVVLCRHQQRWTTDQSFNPDEAAFSGAACFLRIPGMPTKPFKHTDGRNKAYYPR